MTEEHWKPVVGYEGLYEVSDRGRVKSVAKVSVDGRSYRERILKPFVSRSIPGLAYLAIKLSRDGAKKSNYVHRMVLSAFVGSLVHRTRAFIWTATSKTTASRI
jgi:hypothetical protein